MISGLHEAHLSLWLNVISVCRQDLSITLSTICIRLTYNQHMLQIKGL